MLSADGFIVLAGHQQETHWDPSAGRRRKRLGAVLCKTTYGWSVRTADGLGLYRYARSDTPAALRTREAGIAWGTAWANADPDNRGFYAANRDLDEPDTFALPVNREPDDLIG